MENSKIETANVTENGDSEVAESVATVEASESDASEKTEATEPKKTKRTKTRSAHNTIIIVLLLMLVLAGGVLIASIIEMEQENPGSFSFTDFGNLSNLRNLDNFGSLGELVMPVIQGEGLRQPTTQNPTRVARQMGIAIRAYIHDEAGDEIIATILGKDISARHFNITAKLYELAGSNDPETDAWNAMKVQAYERRFAIDREIYPTSQEIRWFTLEMREMVEKTPEALEILEILLEAAGITADEYWNNFKLTYESPTHLTSLIVAEYRVANGWHDLTAETIVRRANELIARENDSN